MIRFFLKMYSFLDPRYKDYVQAGVCQGNLRKNIERFCKSNDDDIIPGTQGQELENISNSIFQTPRTSSPRQNSDMSILEQMNMTLMGNDIENDELASSTKLSEKIDKEIISYGSLALEYNDKSNMDILKW